MNHLNNRQVVLDSKLKIPLVVRGNAHDGACSIVGKNVIGHPDGHTLVVVGIHCEVPGGYAVFFDCAQVSGFPGPLLLLDHLLDLSLQLRVGGSELGHQRMLRGKLHAGRAEDRVYARSKNANPRFPCSLLLLFLKEEIYFGAFAAPNPVALHRAHLFRPAIQLIQAVEQFLRVSSNAEEPLHQVTLFYVRVFMPPAASVDHLFIGQHRGALRTPVHLALLAIDQAPLVHAQEEPLVPAVVVG